MSWVVFLLCSFSDWLLFVGAPSCRRPRPRALLPARTSPAPAALICQSQMPSPASPFYAMTLFYSCILTTRALSLAHTNMLSSGHSSIYKVEQYTFLCTQYFPHVVLDIAWESNSFLTATSKSVLFLLLVCPALVGSEMVSVRSSATLFE